MSFPSRSKQRRTISRWRLKFTSLLSTSGLVYPFISIIMYAFDMEDELSSLTEFSLEIWDLFELLTLSSALDCKALWLWNRRRVSG